MEATGKIIASQDDEFMQNLNDKHEGAMGQSLENPIQGFNEDRRMDRQGGLGAMLTTFGSSLKQLFFT
jgi:hypothetical protein